MAKHLCILVSPDGEEFYEAYGPMTKLRDQATRFATAAVASGAANQRFGRHNDAFWNSERASRDIAAKQYRQWTSRTEEVGDDDIKREGYYVASYTEGSDERRYAHADETGRILWTNSLCGCELWTDRNDACRAIANMPKPEGHRMAVAAY